MQGTQGQMQIPELCSASQNAKLVAGREQPPVHEKPKQSRSPEPPVRGREESVLWAGGKQPERAFQHALNLCRGGEHLLQTSVGLGSLCKAA